MDERDRRKAAEARLAELEGKQEEKPTPDILEDPEAYAKRLKDDVNHGVLERHFDSSEYRARKAHGDNAVEDAIGVFNEMVKADPLLAKKALEHPEPFDFVIDTVKAHKRVEDAGGVEELLKTERQRMRAEIEAEIREELDGKAEAKAKTRESLPETLAGESNKGERTSPEPDEPTLDDMVTNIEDAPPPK